MKRTALFLVLAAVLGLGTSSCAEDPGSSGRDSFRAYIEKSNAQWIDRLDIHPGSASFFGSSEILVMLRADTPEDVFADFQKRIKDYGPPFGSRLELQGLAANGVGVCSGDPAAPAKTKLRTQLQATGKSLAGTWTCKSGAAGDHIYRGSTETFLADRKLLNGLPMWSDGPAIQLNAQLEGELNEPRGTVNAILQDVPAGLESALYTVSAREEIAEWTFENRVLTIAVEPSTAQAAIQEAATAAGGGLTVQVRQGSVAGAALAPEAAGLRAAFRGLPGVKSVRMGSGTWITVTLSGVSHAASVVKQAQKQPEFTARYVLELRLPVAWQPRNPLSYSWLDGKPTQLRGFEELAGNPAVTALDISDSADKRLEADFKVPLNNAASLVRPLVAMGAWTVLRGPDDSQLNFHAAKTLTQESFEYVKNVDQDQFIKAWNAAR